MLPRLLRPAATARSPSLLLETLTLDPPPRRNFTADPVPSAFDRNLLRTVRSQLTYLSDYHLPLPPPAVFRSFRLDHRLGQKFARLRSHNDGGREEVNINATMFDGALPAHPGPDARVRLHISLVVEISKGGDSDSILQFVCSAWPDSLEVEKVFPLLRRGDNPPLVPYMGRELKKLDVKMQDAVYGYLEERGVDDELAKFLHDYMANKEKAEAIWWLGTVESYVQR